MNPHHRAQGQAALLLICLLTLIGLSVFPIRSPRVHAAGQPVTWRGQIAPIVYKNCTSCHHASGSAPFDLTTYAQAKRWATQMQSVTATRYMPPWLPSPGHGEFAGDRRLPAIDIEQIAAWAKAGAPEGEGPAPSPPMYATDWQLGMPDLVLTMPQAVSVSASGGDIFENFVLPADVKTTRWVRAMEIKPGPPQLTHHANVILDRTESLRHAHPADWQKGVPGMDLTVDSGDKFDPDSHFLFWKPDSTALVEPAGMPWRLDPGDDLVLNMHLKPTGKPESVQASIGLYFAADAATERPMLLQLERDGKLAIPAGDANFVVTDELTLPMSVDVLGIYPHAHYLGKRMEAWATLPNGERRWLVLIEDWDIDRQSVYRFAHPVPLPKGSVLHMRYLYDNSTANIRNPHAPPVPVHAGNNSTDEMAHLWLQVLPKPERDGKPSTAAKADDPRVLLEAAWMEARLRKDPGDPLATYNLASAELAEGHSDKAIALYRELVTHSPGDARARTALGSALVNAGEYAGAAQEFRTVLAKNPDYADAEYDLASLLLRTGDLTQAEKRFAHLVMVQPSDFGAQLGLANTLLAESKNAEAREHYAAAVVLDPRSIEALQGVAQAALQAGDTAAAESALNKAAAIHDDGGTRRLLAMTFAAENRSDAALAELHAWAKLSPNNPEPHRALAQLLSALGDYKGALEEQHRVLALAPGNAADWNDLGVLEARGGQRADARRDIEHALKLDPTNAEAKNNLSKL